MMMVSPPDSRLRSSRPKSAMRYYRARPADISQQVQVLARSGDGGFTSLSARGSSSSSQACPPQWPARPPCLDSDELTGNSAAFGEQSGKTFLESSGDARRAMPASPCTPHFGSSENDDFAEDLSRRLEKAQCDEDNADAGTETDTTASGSPGGCSQSFSSADSPSSITPSLSPRRHADFSSRSRPSSAYHKWSDVKEACSTAVPSASCSRPSSANSWGTASGSVSGRASTKIRERVAEARMHMRGPWPGAGEGPPCGGLPPDVGSSTCWALAFDSTRTTEQDARCAYGGAAYEKLVAYEDVRAQARHLLTSQNGSVAACEFNASLDDAKERRHTETLASQIRRGRSLHRAQTPTATTWCAVPPMAEAQRQVAPWRHGVHNW